MRSYSHFYFLYNIINLGVQITWRNRLIVELLVATREKNLYEILKDHSIRHLKYICSMVTLFQSSVSKSQYADHDSMAISCCTLG